MQKRKIKRNRPPQRIAVLPRIISGGKKKKKRGDVSLDHKKSAGVLSTVQNNKHKSGWLPSTFPFYEKHKFRNKEKKMEISSEFLD